LNLPDRERSVLLERLGTEIFDLLVIGGGITGVGIARDAALRGLKVALVDKADFAAGTSSKSSKLVHGGLRYLEHAKFRLVFEGTHERAVLGRVAPHLVRPLEFLMPTYRGDPWGLFALDVGLWLYDALSKFSSPRIHRTLRKKRTLQLEPSLRSDDLTGGILYYDSMTSDARLTIENMLDARRLGATVLNYVIVAGLLRRSDRVVGAELRDVLDERAPVFPIRARVVVNAAGPWSDSVRRLADDPPILAVTKGVHLVVDRPRLPITHAIVMRQDRRVIFCIPWERRTVIGTTDTYYDGNFEEVSADSSDVRYLLEVVNRYFPNAKLIASDVLATWAGLRPLIRPQARAATASDISREHVILSRPGVVTIAGGKLTTYRRIAAEVVDEVGEQLHGISRSSTKDRPLPGGSGLKSWMLTKLIDELQPAVDPDVAAHLVNTYGVRAASVTSRIAADLVLGARLDPELPHLLAEVDVAVLEESAECLDDVLERRVPLLLLARDQGLDASEQVAARMATLLGWSEARRQAELEKYRTVVALSRRFQRS
jgi:glycerol-3-phosphate dehydrogenase